MNKLFFFSIIMGLLSFVVSCSVEQEFIKQPKEKKIYPSCQQYIELMAEIVSITNTLMSQCIEFQRSAIVDINGYVEGNKNCFLHNATKKQRSQAYADKKKLKEVLQDTVNKLLLIAN